MPLLVGTRKGLFRIVPGAGGWTVEDAWFLGDPVPILHTAGGRILAGLDLGHFGAKMHRSVNGGRDWMEVGVPTYPQKPEGIVDRDATRGLDIPWTTKLLWALSQDSQGTLWCGTIPGGLFRSTDGGDSWEIVRSLWDHPGRAKWVGGGYDFPGIHCVLVDPRDEDSLTVGVSVGGLWHSVDAGSTWKLIGEGMRAEYTPPELATDPASQDPHMIAQCRAQPDRLWMQHHNGVFRSDDRGATWHELDMPPSGFGFAVAAHPTDPHTAWFVPAVKDEKRIPVDGQVVVTRTRNGGASFEVLRDGLPQDYAYDLVYRHALDVSADGDTLAFGSTTGSLWVSGDQGDSWEAISRHLPPILCVRFE